MELNGIDSIGEQMSAYEQNQAAFGSAIPLESLRSMRESLATMRQRLVNFSPEEAFPDVEEEPIEVEPVREPPVLKWVEPKKALRKKKAPKVEETPPVEETPAERMDRISDLLGDDLCRSAAGLPWRRFSETSTFFRVRLCVRL